MARKPSIVLLTIYVLITKCSSKISPNQVSWCSVAIMNPNDLDSNDQEAVENVKALLHEEFNSKKDPWIMRGMYDYFLLSNSPRVVDVIASVQEPHDNHFFDKSLEGLTKSSNKLPHLALLGYVVRKRPTWLFKISQHAVFSELIRLLMTENDIVTVVNALLIMNVLLPLIPGVLGKHLPKIFSVFSKLAAVNASSDKYHEAELIHLQISLYTLFHRLYGMFPHNFLLHLHKDYSGNENMSPVFSHTIKPMLDTVRVNPLMITGSAEWEKDPLRWKNIEPHDIIVSCAKLLMSSRNFGEPNTSAHEVRSSFDCNNMLGALKVSGKHSVVDYCNELGRKSEDMSLWSPSSRLQGFPHYVESTPTNIPVTPITRGFEVSSPYSEHDGSSPPETAVEATPETTPSRVNEYTDLSRPPMLKRIVNRPVSPVTGSKVPTSDRSFPNSPAVKDVPQFPFTIPSSPISKSNPVEKLLLDRHQVTEDNSVIEFKPVGPIRNDLNANFHRDKLISTSTSTAPTATLNVEHRTLAVSVARRQTNGHNGSENGHAATHENDVRNLDSVDDYEDCEQEKSGSPCTSGGLHMPDRAQWQKFVTSMRIRYYSQTQSDTDGRSTGTSPQDINNYLNENKVRRTNSCPEMKKSSPNSIISFGHSDKLSLPEENEEDEDTDNTTARSFTENHVSKRVDMIAASTQTEDIQPFHFPYEHLFLDVFPSLPSRVANEHCSPLGSDPPSVYEKMYNPSQLLQKYIEAAVSCHSEKTPLGERTGYSFNPESLKQQLKLLNVHIQFEEQRREIHAERNRRLLGRSRRNKTLEEHNSALKDQVLLQQKELELNAQNLRKIEQIKDDEIQSEREAAEYWKERYGELEKDYKKISDRCLEIEAQLEDEKNMAVKSKKLIFEGKAALIDVTNELHTSQREAEVAKELRPKVAKLQAEILKAGEMIVRYHRRLSDLIKPPLDGTQHELLRAAYVDEISRLKHALNIQSASLKATEALINELKEELAAKENDSRRMAESYTAAQEELRRELQELRDSHEELKKSYNREVERVQELTYQLDNAKRVNRLSQLPPDLRR